MSLPQSCVPNDSHAKINNNEHSEKNATMMDPQEFKSNMAD